MAPESVGRKSISLKDSLSKVPLEHKPTIEFFAECIDKHRELSLEQKKQWLTFVTSEYEPRGTIRKPKGYSDVSKILGIPKSEIAKHMDALGDSSSFDNLWEQLKKEIDLEAKKNPDLFKSLRTREAPIPKETIAKVIKLRKKGVLNAVIAERVDLPETRLDHLTRRLVNAKKVPSRGYTKSRPTVQS